MAECSKGWLERCADAKGHKCTCACGGKHHGKNRIKTGNGIEREPFKGEIISYKGYGTYESKCGVQIKENNGSAIVILTELPDNPGTSITNAFEDIATILYKERLSYLAPENIRWIEHYPARGKGISLLDRETFDEVMLKWNKETPDGKGCYQSPEWKRISGMRRRK